MKAFIPAAGFGTRMGDLTGHVPKPLLPVDGYPLLCYTLFRLWQWGIEEAIINTHYLGEAIEDYVAEFPHFPIRFSREQGRILGTAGGIRNALHLLGNEPFLVANPDQILLLDSPRGSGGLLPLVEGADPPLAMAIENGGILLFVSERAADSKETGFVLRADRLLAPADNGGFQYMGLAVVGPNPFATLAPGEYAELRPVLARAAERGLLFGSRFCGRVADAGSRETYLALRSRHLGGLPSSEWEAFESFVRGWAARTADP